MRYSCFLFLFPLLLQAAYPEFYVWQRNYTRNVENGIIEANKSGCRRFYFIAGEMENNGRNIAVAPAYPSWLSGKVTPVIRIHVKHLASPAEKLAQQILKLYEPWKTCRSLQIDLDAPESKIAYYTALMRQLRTALPDVELSATVLPCHLRHKEEFFKLAKACDFYVLQIHGLEKRSGKWSIIDRNTALNAIIRAVNHQQKFKIAVPLYSHNINGITVKPDIELVGNICRYAQQNNIGIIIFRLGIPGDGETVSVYTAENIYRRNYYNPTLQHYWIKAENGAWHLYIRNVGNFAENATFDLNWSPDFFISDLDTLNDAKLSYDRKTLTLRLPPDGKEKLCLWLRTPTLFDNSKSPLTIKRKD